ncbi:MAG: ABC transporter ATP-binding protein [Planctomycetota bacterium]
MNPTHPEQAEAGAATAERGTVGTTMQPLLRIEHLRVSFPGSSSGGGKTSGGGRRVQAADGVSMTVFPKQTLAVVGESGSGKSVSALSCLQLIPMPPGRHDGGTILWREDGGESPVDLTGFNEKQMRRVRGNQIAMIFQEPMTSLNPVYTVGDQIREAILLHRDVTHDQATELEAAALKDVGIADPHARLKSYPHHASGGMRQRFMIAMALACEPRLLLADEPTTALDVTIQAQILELLRHLQREKGMAVMLITHDLGVVAENADVVAVMFAGRVVEVADVHTLFASPLHPYTRGLLASMPVLGRKQGRLPGVMDGATIPDDLPAGFSVKPHDPTLNPVGGYGGPNAKLHEVSENHWLLCEREGFSVDAPGAVPELSFIR